MENDTLHPMVSIQKATYANMDIDSLVKPLGGFSKFIKKEEKVLLKTNLLNATEPEKAVVTNPDLIREVVTSVKRAGGLPYIGDSPSGNFSKRRLQRVYRKTGLLKLSQEIGVELNYDTSHKKVQIKEGEKLNSTRICNYVFEADKIIALPKIKTHSLMMMSLATKIMFGAIPGLTKARYHSRFIRRAHFADMLLDVLSVTTPDLVIMDGITAMEGEGPMGGTPVDLGIILASTHPTALDLAVCEILGIEPMGIPTLKQAKLRKMWPDTISYPLLSPKDVKYKGFVLPSTANHLLTGEKKPKKYPVMTNDCVACGECKNICPRKAITIKEGKAGVDYEKCIKCYCCHEVCTYNAITLETMQIS